VQPKTRNQPKSSRNVQRILDQLVDADNEVRLIDVFVESIKLEEYHFAMRHNSDGRPAYHPKDLHKFFICDYLNSIRPVQNIQPH
jgi:transposase